MTPLARATGQRDEALKFQAATGEILKVIRGSPSDTQPVFEMIVRNAVSLCNGFFASAFRYDGERLHLIATSIVDPVARKFLAGQYPMPPDKAQMSGRAILARKVVRMEDALADPLYDRRHAEIGSWRRMLGVPMIDQGEPIGVIVVSWADAGPIPKAQEELLKTFADQAVIAIENVRLFNETKEALERQTATADILKVISGSPTNTRPVFDAIVKATQRLVAGQEVGLVLRRDSRFVVASYSGGRPEDLPEEVRNAPLDRTKNFPSRAILDGQLVQVTNWEGDDVPEHERLVAKTYGVRSGLMVPLLRDGAGIGALVVLRQAAGRFHAKEISLLQSFADQAVIAIENVRLFNETREALERQTSISEVLTVISSSPTDLAPILDAVASRAAKLCDATDARIFLVDGREVRHVAGFGDLPVRTPVFELNPGTSVGTAILKGQPVHVHDIELEGDMYPLSREIARKAGWRTTLNVPLMREHKALGAIALRRRDVRPFTDRQIALLKVFADQAAIAIENVRLFNETKEALEKQTATADILQVLSGSPSDTQPVFDAIVQHAARLCESTYANVFRFDGERIHLAASQGGSPEALAALRASYPAAPNRKRVVGRVVETGCAVHVEDTLADAEYDRAFAGTLRLRRLLGVPLLRAGRPIGAITVGWAAPGPIRPRHEDLLRTFADQAVIAIENVRLFNETKEALEQQIATSDILKVISGSTSDTRPVFEAIVRSAAKLFAPCNAAILMRDGASVDLRATDGPDVDREVRERLARMYPLPFDPERSMTAASMLERRVIACEDTEGGGVPATGRAIARASGFRSFTIVPLVREGEGIGTIVITSPNPGHKLDAKQLALLRTFADQAVIAIENARLFNETKEALERQTATSDVLKVISSTPTDPKPVFDAIVQAARRIFDGMGVGITLVHDKQLHLVAFTNPEAQRNFPMPLDRQSTSGIAILERRAINIADAQHPDAPSRTRTNAGGFRAVAAAPLIREGEAVGALLVTRRVVGALSDRQLSLLQTFADQAVIAIENARLFNETKEALEQQTATAEVLKVISASPTSVAPVFDAILKSAVTLCGAELAAVFSYDGKLVHLGATHKWPAEAVEYFSNIYPSPPSAKLLSGRTILSKSVVQIADSAADPNYDPNSVITGKWRRMLGAPMLREGRPLGALIVSWRDPGETPPRQVELLQTFADQAAIAIENARLFNETKEALERQTAISEILEKIAGSPTDVAPVLQAVAERAARLCEAEQTTVLMVEGDMLKPMVTYSRDQGPLPNPATVVRLDRGYVAGRAALDGAVVNVDDTVARLDEFPLTRENQKRLGYRSFLAAPMMRQGRAIGVIAVWRRAVRPFSDKHEALTRTFADQAAIAIENVRLFNETKEALDQQKASAEVLGAISGSIADTKPVFEKILASCERLFEGELVGITLADGDTVRLAAYHGPQGEQLKNVYPLPLTRESGTGWAILNARIAHFPDIEGAGVPPGVVAGCRTLRVRAIVFAPMLFEGKGIGAIWVARAQVGAFTDKQIAQLRTFADQAVIAIQNARLFREIQEKSAQLEVANKHKSDFLANMSHELRTPLNAIIGFSEVLSDRMFGEVNEKQAEYLKDIHESGRHLLSLINDILDLSKIEAGRMELELSSFDLPGAVSNAMTLVRERAQRHGIQLGLEMDPALGQFQADERKVKQILLNLLSNAVKFTPDGGKVDVSTRKVDGKIEIAVRDTGIGIAPEDHAAVFEEFKQVGRDYTRKAEGTGLGLALTKRLVELHGGEIALESAIGKGSTFTVKLPLR